MDVKRILENYEENLLILQNYLAGQNQFGLGDLSPIKDKRKLKTLISCQKS